MLSQGIPADLPIRGEMSPNLDLQQFMLSMDPSARAMQSLYMSQMGLSNGSPSPSSLPSSGSASTTGPAAENASGMDAEAKTPTPAAPDMGALLAGLLPQMAQNNGIPSSMSALLEQMQSSMGMFNPLGALQQGMANGSPTKVQKKKSVFEDSPMKTHSPQQPVHFGFPFSLAPSTSTASQPSVIVANDDVTGPAQKKSRQESDEDEKSPLDSFLMASMNGVNTACDECGKECGTPLALYTHKSKEHIENARTSLKCNECDKEFESAQFLEQHKLVNHNSMAAAQRLLAGMNLPAGFPALNFMMPGMPQQFPGLDFDPAQAMAQLTPKQTGGVKRQYSSNGKNYCDLCNKEVCNKYFLRTHMLKMHGIVIDENKTVIANIDTLEKERQGTLQFRCDICHAELKTRQLLRTHKQENHGVVPMANTSRKSMSSSTPSMVVPSSPMTSSSMPSSMEDSSRCPMCHRNVPSNQLALHIQNDHAGEMNSITMGAAAPVSQPNSPLLECKMCSMQFKDPLEQQLHRMQVHAAEFFHAQIREERKSDPSILRCKECQYTTKDQRNLEMHVERHERMNDVKQQPEEDEDEALQMTTEVALQMAAANQMEGGDVFKCGECSMEYADEASLEAHSAVAHTGLNLTVHKKEKENEEKTAVERNSHTSGSISPSTESLPEAFAKTMAPHVTYQQFILKTNDAQGNLLSEMVATLPVRVPLSQSTVVTFELVPQTPQPF